MNNFCLQSLGRFLINHKFCSKRSVKSFLQKNFVEVNGKQIFEAASSEKLNSQDVVIYMAVRTNHRMILNAQACIDDIKEGKIKDQEQLAAYQWMIIQPFLTIDGFSVALLSDRQKCELEKIANDFSNILYQLESNNANAVLQCDELAQQILKIYIASL